MKFYRGLYVSDSAKKNKKKILYRLKHRKLCLKTSVITLPMYGTNLLEIYQANELLQPHYKKCDIEVVGIATDKDDACELATRIIQDVYTATNNFNIKEYLGF